MKRVVIAGGGAAGFFAAITCAEADRKAEVLLLEKGPQFLQKVRISGGGRCNVTHACFEPRELALRYPRGERELIGPYHQFQAEDTVRWFEERGVRLKTEADGRMFPITDNSQTIVDCLMRAAERAGVKLRANTGVDSAAREAEGFKLRLANGESLECGRLLLATGGCRTPTLGALAVSLGHTLAPPVPSLFTFHIEAPWVRGLAGLSVPLAEASVAGSGLRERGPLLFTHWGLSGPVILRLSAWGARALHELDYKFILRVNWLPAQTDLRAALQQQAQGQPAKLAANAPLAGLPARLWAELLRLAGAPENARWSQLSRAAHDSLARVLSGTELAVSGKSLNKDEFVTCGGVRLSEVNFKTMESKLCPGLHFAGELLDIDGITGGFNFQAAWTTGWLAGRAMAEF